jgi:hypothetical protein
MTHSPGIDRRIGAPSTLSLGRQILELSREVEAVGVLMGECLSDIQPGTTIINEQLFRPIPILK